MIAKGLNDKINNLQKYLRYNDEFQEIFTYFFDELAADSRFMPSSSALSEAPFISKAVQLTLKSLFNEVLNDTRGSMAPPEEDKMAFIIIQHIKASGFYHGPIAMFGGIGSYFFFEDEGVGLLNMKFPGSDKVWYSRFSTIKSKAGAFPQFNTEGATMQN